MAEPVATSPNTPPCRRWNNHMIRLLTLDSDPGLVSIEEEQRYGG